MDKRKQKIITIILVVAALITGIIVFFLSFSLNAQYDYSDLGVVFDGDKALLWTHVITNLFIGIAYMFIPITLLRLVKKTGHKIPFTWTFFAFGGFIIACGVTHFMASLTTWVAVWWVAQIINWATVIVSMGTAIAIVPLVPEVVGLVESAALSGQRKSELEEANKKLQAEIRNAKKARQDVVFLGQLNKQKDLFLSQVSHEIKTPIVPIMGYVEMISSGEYGKISKKQKEKLAIVYRNVQQLRDLINDMLDASRLDLKRLELHFTKVDLAVLVHDLRENFLTMAKQFKTTVTLDCPAKIFITCDKDRISQAVQNIIKNAIENGKKGQKNQITITVKDQGGSVMVEIIDKGKGIPKKEVRKLFNKFERTDQAVHSGTTGSGLGLYISKGLVEAHGGTITLKSKEGVGSAFTITLPKKTK
ncbi:hypothetical protein COV20_01450 [Candidatus Woesearchaeota archaeon CG10_big_fil_rev_8_21_14_0_10_45_16]|nr:MAG: hypothetical protein COV20_01450 [Candidatus Woesearchaeota archaeon CG10_big_fil_rev_8_21_14_0_10_45_16]